MIFVTLGLIFSMQYSWYQYRTCNRAYFSLLPGCISSSLTLSVI